MIWNVYNLFEIKLVLMVNENDQKCTVRVFAFYVCFSETEVTCYRACPDKQIVRQTNSNKY